MRELVSAMHLLSPPSAAGRAVAYHPTTVSREFARRWRASIWRLKSFPMATSSPRSACGTAKAFVISTFSVFVY
jgi:hypothetical protein